MSDAPSSSASSVHEDLAFLRTLVDDGDWRPGLWAFGAIYVSVGVILVIHVAISWGASTGLLPLKGWSLIAAYVVLYSGGPLIWNWIGARARKSFATVRGVKSRAGGVALGASFLGHLVMLAVFLIVALRQQNGIFLEFAPLVLFVLQGIAWFVIHAMRRERWHLLEAWGWMLSVLALAPLVGTDFFGPGIALAAIVLMIVPGVYMIRVSKTA